MPAAEDKDSWTLSPQPLMRCTTSLTRVSGADQTSLGEGYSELVVVVGRIQLSAINLVAEQGRKREEYTLKTLCLGARGGNAERGAWAASALWAGRCLAPLPHSFLPDLCALYLPPSLSCLA